MTAKMFDIGAQALGRAAGVEARKKKQAKKELKDFPNGPAGREWFHGFCGLLDNQRKESFRLMDIKND